MTARRDLHQTPDFACALTNLSVWYMISKCAVEKVNYDYQQYAKARLVQALQVRPRGAA